MPAKRTNRNAQREQIARERKRRPLLRKAILAGKLLGFFFAIGALYVLIAGGYALAGWYTIRGTFINSTSALGLNIEEIYISGTDRITVNDVVVEIPNSTVVPPEYINEDIMPLYGVSLSKLRDKLEHNSWVKTAHIRRQLPDTLHIDIRERVPSLIWTNGSVHYLADDEGALIEVVDDNSEHFLLVEGGTPDRHIPALLAMVKSAPDIFETIIYAKWVGNRRWNLMLADGTLIKLPDHHTIATWQELVRMHRDDNLLERAVETIDLRDPERFYLKLKDGSELRPRR